jgi:capsular exopolysaccharide synthesis family protein
MPSLHLDSPPVSLAVPGSFAAEQYQTLRYKLERLRQTRDLRIFAVTSPDTGDGKTVVSINLAGALGGETPARVLLIDADLRRPSVTSYLGLTDVDGTGLADLVADERKTLTQVIRTFEHLNFDLVPAGASSIPVHEILRSPRLEQVLQEARTRYDYVVLDTPPLFPVIDSALLSRSTDGMLIVVSANKTPRKLLEEALNLLDPGKVLGIVFNGDRAPLFGYYNGGYRGYLERTAGAPRSL